MIETISGKGGIQVDWQRVLGVYDAGVEDFLVAVTWQRVVLLLREPGISEYLMGGRLTL